MTRYLHRLAERSLRPASAVHSRLRLPFASIPAPEIPPLFEAFHEATIERWRETTATPVMGRADGEAAPHSRAKRIMPQGLLKPIMTRTPSGIEATLPLHASARRQRAADTPAHDTSSTPILSVDDEHHVARHTVPLRSQETDEMGATARGAHPALDPNAEHLSAQFPTYVAPAGTDPGQPVRRHNPSDPLVSHYTGRSQLASLLPARLLGIQPPAWRSTSEIPDAPEVQVTIGRIEVTAVHAPAAPRHPLPPAKKPMSLDEYLTRRGRRGR